MATPKVHDVNVAVRWVYSTVVDRKLGKVEAGQRPSLIFRGVSKMLCVVAGTPVRVVLRNAEDFDKMRIVLTQGQEYPVEKAVKMFKDIAERNGITVGASKLLDRAMRTAAGMTAEEEGQFNDEEEIDRVKNETPADVIEQSGEGGDADATAATPAPNKEKSVTKVKAKAAPAAKAKGKAAAAPAKARALPASKKAEKKEKVAGPTPFRVGTMKEKAFLAYKDARKTYDALDKAKAEVWRKKLADKLGASPSTIASWIGGPFRKALDKK